MSYRTHKPFVLFLTATLLFAGFPATYAESRTKVVCVGNSITAGDWLADRMKERYPAVLSDLLGEDYEVHVIAKGGLCAQRDSNDPMWSYGPFAGYFSAQPDITILELGTNDSQRPNWVGKEIFSKDFAMLLDTLLSVDPRPKLFVVKPPPALIEKWTIQGPVIEEFIAPAVCSLAQQRGLPIIDFFKLFIEHPDLLHDGIHPDKEGAVLMAQLVYDAITESTSAWYPQKLAGTHRPYSGGKFSIHDVSGRARGINRNNMDFVSRATGFVFIQNGVSGNRPVCRRAPDLLHSFSRK